MDSQGSLSGLWRCPRDPFLTTDRFRLLRHLHSDKEGVVIKEGDVVEVRGSFYGIKESKLDGFL